MPIFPYDEEERKRRLLLTPGINPNAPLPNIPTGPVPMPPGRLPGGLPPATPLPAPPPGSSLPEIPTPMPALAGRAPGGMPPATMPGPRPEVMDNSGVNVPLPALSGNGPATPYSPENKARYDYVMQGARRDEAGNLTGGFKRSVRDIGKSALTGFLQGIGSGGGLAGGLGGAITGGAYGAIDPRGAREALFDQTVAPKLQRDMAQQQQQQQMARQQQENVLNDQYKQAQIGALNRSNMQEPMRPLLPHYEKTTEGIINLNAPENKGKVFKPYEAPKTPVVKPPTAAELATDPESGMSWEEMADASYEARGGDQYVFDRLPAKTRQLIDKGAFTNAEGKEVTADPAEVRAAERAYQSAINRQRQTDKEYSRGAVRSKRLGGPQNPTSPRSASAKPMRGQPGRKAISVQEAADLLR